MPYYIIKLSNDNEKTKQLKFALAQSPNGTPLCCGQGISSPSLSDNIRIYWLEEKYATLNRIESIQKLEGVISIEELNEDQLMRMLRQDNK